MQEKYLVEISDPTIEIGFYHKNFKTRQEIVTAYNIPLYIVDKIIKMSNDLSYTTKRKGHRIFQTIFTNMKIYLIQPKLII